MIAAPNFLSKWQRDHILIQARNHLERTEDQQDFMQLCYLICWDRISSHGLRADKYVFDIKLAVRAAKYQFFKYQRDRTPGHAGQSLLDEEQWRIVYETQMYRCFGDLLDSCVPNNFKDWGAARKYKLVSDCGNKTLRLSFDEIAEGLGTDRANVIQLRQRERPLRFYVFENKVYKGIKEIVEKCNVSTFIATTKCQRVCFYWADKDRRGPLPNRVSTKKIRFSDEIIAQFGKVPETQIAAKLGVARHTIQRELKRRGIPCFSKSANRLGFDALA